VPIVLSRIDVHAVWVSPAVLEQIGEIPLEDVDGGKVVRDAEGKPTGVFVDNAIRAYVTPVQPEKTDTERENFLRIVSDDALRLGMTGIHDAGLLPVEVEFFRRMADEGKLPLRYYTMLLCKNQTEYCGANVERAEGAGDGRWTLRSVKLYGDGALGSRGAALIEDYSDQPGWKGFLLTPEESWAPTIKKWYDEGWQVNVHAIGDKANRVVIDAMEAAIGDDPAKGRESRLRIEHAQIMTPADLERAAKLGIIASYQPTHATSDMHYAEERLGPERLHGAYAWQSYLKAGGRTTLGSDFPVEEPSPLKGFFAAVARTDEKGDSPHGPGGWVPEEKLSREQALRGFTADRELCRS
jgi:predicted amidohydrolase YtcJ